MKPPILIDNVLNEGDYNHLKNSIVNPKSFEYSAGFGRYVIGDNTFPLLKTLSHKLIPKAREAFDSKNLLPTYALFAHYEGRNPKPQLHKHKDSNACTYTLDMCVYQKESWDLWVEDKPYTILPNQALAYYGEDQWHWREEFPNPETNYVAMIFFHYAEPDHWFFTKGPSYVSVIRNEMSEEDWLRANS
jgi:phenylpyruvate tautomerase PptA (4-oxalocrotonate tautomerase family)